MVVVRRLGQRREIGRFGNGQLNIAPEMLADAGARVGSSIEVRLGESARRARWVRTFADAKPSELVLLVDSYGMCTLALDRASAAKELGLRTGRTVTLVTAGPGERDA